MEKISTGGGAAGADRVERYGSGGELNSEGADVPVIPEHAPAASVHSGVGDFGHCFEVDGGFRGMRETGEAHDCNCD